MYMNKLNSYRELCGEELKIIEQEQRSGILKVRRDIIDAPLAKDAEKR